ncbi:MAG: septum formation protein Maf [Chloroflexi bacterium]|nr:MAG: septum formation protein Maf [Chloroflexota bacterium]
MTQPPQPLILASASPRRRELLRYLTPNFRVWPTQGEDEARFMARELAAHLPAFPLPPQHHPTLLAWRKVTAAGAEGAAGVILGADTIVVIDDAVLNKPRDAAEAQGMLRRLAGRTHQVYTGVAVGVTDNTPALQLALDVALVQMAPLTETQISAYVATGEPLDKAGAYGIQGLGGQLVQSVTGSYTCVVGLPLVLTHQVLAAAGLSGLADPVAAFERWLAETGRGTPACTAP